VRSINQQEPSRTVSGTAEKALVLGSVKLAEWVVPSALKLAPGERNPSIA